ncbi:MAG TPA: winged helix-turn-helix domain-containing protein [Rugosimonospora sp.]|jgi:hypothetical protein
MPAATASDLSTTARPRRALAAAPGRESEPDPSTTWITVTLHIDLRGGSVPPAVAGLLESVRALAGPAGVTVAHTAAPVPNGWTPTGGPGRERATQDPAGQDRAAQDPAAQDRIGQDRAGHDRAAQEWVARERAVDDPAVRDGRGADAAPSGPVDGWPARLRPRLVRGGEPAAAGASLRIYLASRMVLRSGAPIRLTRREYDLLTFLCEYPRRVFSRRQLMRQVWGHEMVGGERTVDVHVRRLRVKLGEPGPVISTVRGVGYRLDDAASVDIVADGERPADRR